MKLKNPPLWLRVAIVAVYFVSSFFGFLRNPNNIYWQMMLTIGVLWLAFEIYYLNIYKKTYKKRWLK